ncbi:MAG TPA: hypothetical protein VLD36_12175 [Burkholderiales bacterium]|nr:hypothetical protein [Burkholderiales bacterium]
MPKSLLLRAAAAALAALLIAGCSTLARSSLDASWIDPTAKGKKFKKVLILSVAHDEFAQQYFQQDMAAAMRARGMNAVASERFFTHKSPSEQARFMRAVDSSDADAVLLARVIGVDQKTGTVPGMLTGPGGAPVAEMVGIGNAVAATFAPTMYVRPSDYTLTTVIVETVLYELKGRRAVWSARTNTANADQGDLKPAIAQFVSVLVGAMERDGLF